LALWLALILIFFSEIPRAHAEEERNVVSITSANFPKEELDLITRQLGIAVGRPLNTRRIDDGIRELYARGRLQSLFVESEPATGGISVHIRGERARRLHELTFTDVEKDILDEVRNKIAVEPGKVTDARTFNYLADRIRAAYEARGYYSADVETKFTDLADGESDVNITVRKNKPALIGKITVTGASKSDNVSMVELVELKRGDIFARRKLDEGVEKINEYLRANQYPTSKVDDISIDLNAEKTEVEITISVRLNERFQFQFVGNTVFTEIDLRGLMSEEILTQADSGPKIAELIESKYRSVGYHFCRVRVRSQQRTEEKLNVIRFEMDEGPRVRIDAIRIVGSTVGLSVDEIRDMFLKGAPGVNSRKIFWEEGLPEAVSNLKKDLSARGFLSASVSSPRVVFTDDRKGVELFLDVELGTLTQIGQIEIAGNHALSRDEVLAALGVKEGEFFNWDKIEEARKNLRSVYQSHGFVDVAIAGEQARDSVNISRDSKTATLKIDITEGTRYHVGKVSLEGNRKTRDFVIYRQMQLKEGDVYDPVKLRRSEEDIATLGLFSRVEVVASTNPQAPDRKDLKIVVIETPPGVGEIGFGGGYEDPFFRMRTFVGVGYRNLWGLNQTATARTEVLLPLSREKKFFPFLEYSGALGYRAPYPFEIPVTFAGLLRFDSAQIGTTLNNEIRLQTRTKIEGRIEKKLSSSVTGIYRLYQLERTKTETLDDPTSIDTEVIGSTGPGVNIDFRDDIYNPTKGSFHSLNIEIASPILLSQDNISFIMALSRNSFYIPLFPSVGLSLYAGFGYAHSLFAGKSLPTARLVNDLSLGGRASLRGFSVGKFSPVPANGAATVVERTAFYNGRAEITTTIFANVGLAVFYDTGQIYPNLVPAGRQDGVGFGIRYKTPVGPIVVDIAQGLGPDREMLKFYFTVGTI